MSRTSLIKYKLSERSVLCRLCVKNVVRYFNIFIPNETFKVVVDKVIDDLLGLKMAVGDGLPSNVCRQCTRKLIEFHDFKEICLKSDAALRESSLGNYFEGIKEEIKEPKWAAREVNSLENVTQNDIQVLEVYIPIPDHFAKMNMCREEEEMSVSALSVKEEKNDGVYFSGPVTSFSTVDVDPLALDTNIGKEEDDISPENIEWKRVGYFQENAFHKADITILESKPHVSENKKVGARKSESFTAKKEFCPEEVPSDDDSTHEADASFENMPPALENQMDHRGISGDILENTSRKRGNFEAETQGTTLKNIGSNIPLHSSCDSNSETRLSLIPSMDQSSCAVGEILRKQSEDAKRKVVTKSSTHFNGRVILSKRCKLRYSSHKQNKFDDFTVCICDHCGKEYTNKHALSLHIMKHMGGKKTEVVCSLKKELPSEGSGKDQGNLEPITLDPCGENITLKNSSINCEKVSGKKSFRCDICGRGLQNKAALLSHAKTHKDKMVFKCDTCSRVFMRKRTLVAHVAIHTGLEYESNVTELGKETSLREKGTIHTDLRPFKCHICGKVYKEKHYLKKHLLVHAGVKPFECKVCGKKFSRRFILKTHSVVHTGLKEFECEICGRKFGQRSGLNAHVKLHRDVKPFACETCGKEFKRREYLRNHILVHSDSKPYRCDVCGQRFKQRCKLKEHTLLHSDSNPFKCDVCGKAYTKANLFKMHIITHTDVRPFKCEICGKSFHLKSVLKQHVFTHTGLRPYDCGICGMNFNDRSGISKHKLIHTVLRPFKCKICGKGFKRNDYLRYHSAVHSTLKPYRCAECGKCFTQKATLRNHTLTHSSVKQFKCDTCGRAFKFKERLKRHLHVHSDTREFNCHLCEKGFIRKYDLAEHVNVHAGIRPFKCDMCGKAFSYKRALNSHIKNHLLRMSRK